MDVTPKALACSGFCSIQFSMSAPDKKPILRIHEGMECLNSASVAAMVARVASLGYCSNGGELQERFARTCCHSCRDFGRIFGQAFKSLPCVVVERVSGRGRARGQSKAERHDQERGDEPVRRRPAVGGSFHQWQQSLDVKLLLVALDWVLGFGHQAHEHQESYQRDKQQITSFIEFVAGVEGCRDRLHLRRIGCNAHIGGAHF